MSERVVASSGRDEGDSAVRDPAGRARRRPGVRLVVALAVLVVVAGAAWLAVTAVLARGDLQEARKGVSQVRADLEAGKPAAARQATSTVQTQAARARARTSGPLWWAAAHVPWLGSPLRTVRGATSGVDDLARRALPEVVAGGAMLDPRELRVGSDTIDLPAVARASTPMRAAAQAVTAVHARVAALPSSTWLPVVDRARRDLVRQVAELDGTLHDAAVATRVVPPMLGVDGPRRYFVAFQNEAEARGTGGIPGAFAILEADHGRLRFSHFGNDSEINGVAANVDLGPDFARRYAEGLGSTEIFVNSNMSPHFPDAAQVWMAMWRQKTGQRVDGALATDPTALSYLLAATGPVTMADGTRLTAANVVSLTENQVYARYPDTQRRKTFFVGAARTVADTVLHEGAGHTGDLVRALGRAAGEGRLLVYSGRAAEQRELADTALTGQLADTAAPYAGLVVNNRAGTKLDYYLDRSVTYSRATCDATTATVTVRLHNAAPRTGLPEYVTVRADQPGPHQPGQNLVMASLYVTAGADVTGATLDGRRLLFSNDVERGHPVVSADVGLDPGQTRTLVFRVDEPAATGPVTIPRQPLVRPMTTSTRGPSC